MDPRRKQRRVVIDDRHRGDLRPEEWVAARAGRSDPNLERLVRFRARISYDPRLDEAGSLAGLDVERLAGPGATAGQAACTQIALPPVNTRANTERIIARRIGAV